MPNVVPFTVRPIFKTIAYNMYRRTTAKMINRKVARSFFFDTL